MKKFKKVLALSMTAIMLVCTGVPVFAADKSLPLCEFVRLVVIEKTGELPQIMDTHYAHGYMNKAKELNLIGDIPMDKWNENITQTEMDQILKNVSPEIKTKINTILNETIAETITINGKTLDIGDNKPFVRNGNLMVPLRKTAEALGFKVIWEKESNSTHLDNGSVKTTVELGFDNYFKSSSQAIGLTAPFKFGTAPMLVNGVTYVPVQIYDLLFSNPETVKCKDGNVDISQIMVDKNADKKIEPLTK